MFQKIKDWLFGKPVEENAAPYKIETPYISPEPAPVVTQSQGSVSLGSNTASQAPAAEPKKEIKKSAAPKPRVGDAKKTGTRQAPARKPAAKKTTTTRKPAVRSAKKSAI
jgi:hypothetical protein